MKMNFRRLLSASVLLMGCATLASADQAPAAATATATGTTARIDAKADAVLTQLDAFYRSLKSLKLDLDVQLHMQAEGMKQEIASAWSVALQRPNKLAILYKSGQNQFTFVCDGSKTHVYIPIIKLFVVTLTN